MAEYDSEPIRRPDIHQQITDWYSEHLRQERLEKELYNAALISIAQQDLMIGINKLLQDTSAPDP